MDAKSAMFFDDGDWPAIREPQPSDLCGSLRTHEAHEWTGQTTGKKLNCPGYPYPMHIPVHKWRNMTPEDRQMEMEKLNRRAQDMVTPESDPPRVRAL